MILQDFVKMHDDFFWGKVPRKVAPPINEYKVEYTVPCLKETQVQFIFACVEPQLKVSLSLDFFNKLEVQVIDTRQCAEGLGVQNVKKGNDCYLCTGWVKKEKINTLKITYQLDNCLEKKNLRFKVYAMRRREQKDPSDKPVRKEVLQQEENTNWIVLNPKLLFTFETPLTQRLLSPAEHEVLRKYHEQKGTSSPKKRKSTTPRTSSPKKRKKQPTKKRPTKKPPVEKP